MIRPVTGTAMTAAQRQAKKLRDLRASGGDKVCSNMPKSTFDSLKFIVETEGFKERSDAVNAAVDAYAATLRRRKR